MADVFVLSFDNGIKIISWPTSRESSEFSLIYSDQVSSLFKLDDSVPSSLIQFTLPTDRLCLSCTFSKTPFLNKCCFFIKVVNFLDDLL